jgi:hypothetical protein
MLMASTACHRGPLLGHVQLRHDLARRLDQLRLGEQVAREWGELVYRRTKVAAAAFAVLMPLCGCAGSLRPRPTLRNTASHLIFNYTCSLYFGLDTAVARADWPSTAGLDRQREEISYRETIMDRQGRSWFDEDFTYRRFDSTRTGRTTR